MLIEKLGLTRVVLGKLRRIFLLSKKVQKVISFKVMSTVKPRFIFFH